MGTFGTPSSYNNTGALGGATNPTTAQGLSRDRENQKAILELPGTQAWVEKTITDGVIIPTSAEIIVLPEGGASTDSLTTITLTSDGTTTLHEGMPIRLKAANSNTITVVHGAGANNISTIDGNNVVLDTTWYLELKLINGLWVQQETSAYKTANEAKITAKTAATPATTTSLGIGRVATLADMEPGAVVENGPAFPDVKGGVITPTPTANAVPQADAEGRIDGWVTPTAILNASILLTASGSHTPTKTRLARITIKGGGGGGAGGTSYATYGPSGPGGGEAETVTFWALLVAGTVYSYTIGAGGLAGAANDDGGNGGKTTWGSHSAQGGFGGIHASGTGNALFTGGRGGKGGGTGLKKGEDGQSAAIANTNAAPGGRGGGKNGGRGALTEASGQAAEAGTLGCGGGGGDYYRNTVGAAGGGGFVLIEYYDDTVTMS